MITVINMVFQRGTILYTKDVDRCEAGEDNWNIFVEASVVVFRTASPRWNRNGMEMTWGRLGFPGEARIRAASGKDSEQGCSLALGVYAYDKPGISK
jgi:hypothetical protein